MVKKGEYVFVYGTLRRGERADLSRKGVYDQDVTFCGSDRISAKMYSLGPFPGVKLLKHKGSEVLEFNPELTSVVGEVFMVHHPSVFSMLDAYEGYVEDDPKSGLYDRQQIHTEKGVQVWVYTYNGPVIPDQQIESGDWCKNPDTACPQRSLRRA